MYIDKYMQCLQFVFISFLPASTYVFNLDSITSHKIEEKIFVTDFFFLFFVQYLPLSRLRGADFGFHFA